MERLAIRERRDTMVGSGYACPLDAGNDLDNDPDQGMSFPGDHDWHPRTLRRAGREEGFSGHIELSIE